MAGASTESLMEIIKVTNSLSPTLSAEDSVPLLMMKDVAGRIPLHYACKHLHLRDVIQELIVLYAESAKVADVNGFLPIHVACRFGQTVGVIRLLLADYPALVSAKTNKGNTPRMLAEMYMEGGSERKRQVVALLEQKERQQGMRR
jgi:ankyrin repeat protein